MQEPTFLVLTVLAGPPLHGYGIMRAVKEVSGGAVDLRAGTLYAALDRLTQEGLVELAREETSPGGQVRRYYRLTERGSGALGHEAHRRRELAAVAERRLAALARDTGTVPPPATA